MSMRGRKRCGKLIESLPLILGEARIRGREGWGFRNTGKAHDPVARVCLRPVGRRRLSVGAVQGVEEVVLLVHGGGDP
jgi:hypothetical protein